MDILLIGKGMVGSAVYNGLMNYNKIVIVDPQFDPTTTMDNVFLKNHPWTPDFTFICLPTPTVDGQCDVSVIKQTLARHKRAYPDSQVVIKSTITPDKLDELARIDDRFIYNPEFLRAADANSDFVWPDVQVYGGERERCSRLAKLYKNYSAIHDNARDIYCTRRDASLYKYAVNTFLAMKVVWANEMSQLFTNPEIGGDDWDWDTFQYALSQEPRMGKTHMEAPGPDGKYGYGGACFPKDTEALQSFMISEGATCNLLSETIKTNEMFRGQSEADDHRTQLGSATPAQNNDD